MAVTAAGYYFLTFEKQMIDTAGQSIEAETHKEALVADGYTPAFDTHDFRNDLTNEVSGAGYTAGGVAVTSTELTVSAGTAVWDFTDTVYPTVTITDAMAGVVYFNVGADTTDQLIVLQDFVTAASATAANFTIQHHATGVVRFDLTP